MVWQQTLPFAHRPSPLLVIPKGFEPLARRLEICCSIQLSYGTSINFKVQNPIFRRNSDFELFCRGGRIRTYDLLLPKQTRYRATLHPENFCKHNEEWCSFQAFRCTRAYLNAQDLNCLVRFAERGGFDPPVRVTPYDSLANCWFQPLTHLSRWFPNFGTANVVHNATATNTPGKKICLFETFPFHPPY